MGIGGLNVQYQPITLTLAGLQNHAGRAEHSLRGELQCQIARQTHEHGAVGHCFNDQINVSGSASTKACDHIDERFLDPHNLADRAKDRFCDRGVFIGGASAERVRRGALMHQRRRVGHHTHDARTRTRRFLQGRDRQTRNDRDEEFSLRVKPAHGSERILRFHAKN